jgi:glycosyltransferase involved in cell wall biosynthesis
MNKHENYLSVVIVEDNDNQLLLDKIIELDHLLKKTFNHYEIIVVNNNSKDDLHQLFKDISIKITLITLPIKHNVQQAIEAGIDISIGDYIVEIPNIRNNIAFSDIIRLYDKSQEGYDFVFLNPIKIKLSSKLFYKIINKHFSNSMNVYITSSIMQLSSRRGQNKSAELGKRIVNRNISYMISGLKCASIKSNTQYNNHRPIRENIGLMIDTLIFYTNVITNFCQSFSLLFLAFTLLSILYSLWGKLCGNAVPGWSSIIIIFSFAFFGMFLIFAIITRYLHHILHSSINYKNYIYQSVDK